MCDASDIVLQLEHELADCAAILEDAELLGALINGFHHTILIVLEMLLERLKQHVIHCALKRADFVEAGD